jgi:hypothetical protein
MSKSAGRTLRRLVATVAVGTALATAAPAAADCGNRSDFVRGARLVVMGLTADQRLVRFRECSPDRVNAIGTVSGFQGADTGLVGIDFRVQDGKLYGVGNGGGVYTIETATATLGFVNALTAPLVGTSFGVDFNPAADRLRIVSDAGQNLRHNVNPGGTTAVDAPLTAMSGTSVVTALGIVGAAYTNNDLDADTATSLFDLDVMGNRVALQSPPNGVPGAAAANVVPTGNLGIDAEAPAGFDVYTRLERGVSVDNLGFAAFRVNGTPAFYRMNLLTGEAIFIGVLGDDVVDVALPLDQ